MDLYEDVYKNYLNFGDNWKDFLNGLGDDKINFAMQSLEDAGMVAGKSFIDVGCGSGLFSLAAMRLGASRVVSVDVDDGCLECVKFLKDKYYPDSNWVILKGSVLDDNFISSLGRFDYVYSWGVLHHTGNVLKALNNVVSLVGDNGVLYIAIYNNFNPNNLVGWLQGSSDFWWRVKRIYRMSGFFRGIFYYFYKYYLILGLVFNFRNPFKYIKDYSKYNRGMSFYNDIKDWLLGFPYEPLDFWVVKDYLQGSGFYTFTEKKVSGLGCNEFVYYKSGDGQKRRFSVIIPTYNRRDKLDRCIKSVLSSKVDLEVVVWDDGSTDGTNELSVLKDSRVKYFYSYENKGVNYARNQAVSRASGDYLIILDSDDFLVDGGVDFLEKLNLSDINFFGTVKSDGRKMYKCVSGEFSFKDWLSGKVKGEFLPVVSASVFKSDKYNEELFCFEQEFWNRVIKKYGLVVYDIPLRVYSFDDENRVSNMMLKKSMAKRRYHDYKYFYNEFKDDYLSYGLLFQLFKIWCKKCFYKIYSLI